MSNFLKKIDTIDMIVYLTIIFFTFSLPLGNLLTTILLFYFLFNGNFKQNVSKILKNDVAIFCLIYFLFNVLGLLWSDDIKEGLLIVKKQRWFLLFPVFSVLFKPEKNERYFSLYAISNCITLFFSYMIYFGISLPAFMVAEKYCYTPFHHHVDQSILMAFAGYILLRKAVFEKIDFKLKILFSLLAMIMVHNMIITLGRAGQITFFIGLFCLFLEYFRKNIKKAIFISVISSVCLFTILLYLSPDFKHRMFLGIEDIKKYQENDINTSLGQRFTYWKNALSIFMDNKVIGIGTGDFSNEFERIHDERNKGLQLIRRNPHNYYVLVLARLGIIGFILLLFIFFRQAIYIYRHDDIYRYFRVFILLSYMFICMFEIYLQRHFCASSFAFFCALLYNSEK